MSALGDLLKELFPIRGMSEDIFGTQRTDQFVKFGATVAHEIKSATVSSLSSAMTAAKKVPGAVGAAGGAVGGAISSYFSPARIDAFKDAVQLFGVLSKQLARAMGGLVARLPRGLVNTLGAVGGAAYGAARGAVGAIGGAATLPFQAASRAASAVTRFADVVTAGVLRLAAIRYLMDGAFGTFKNFTANLSESNRNLANWNGSIAASFNKLDIQRMRLDIRQGQGTRGTTSELNNQLGMLLQEFQPVRENVANLANIVGINMVKLARVGLEQLKLMQVWFPALKEIIKKIQDTEDELKKGNADKPAGNVMLHELAGMGKGNAQQAGAPLNAQEKRKFLRRHVKPGRLDMQGGGF